MSRRKEATLTDLQLAVMDVVWERGGATAREVFSALQESRGLAYTTVLTVLTRLGEDKVVSAKREGRANRFTAVVSREDAAELSVGRVAGQFFEGSAQSLAAHIVDSGSMSLGDLNQLRELIEKATEKADVS
ncbi:BlaI/MecI/CopY family transcriptional regulator [Candidatus Poribacteria bacterium]|jgi:BlaI family transcriptional regulator, penicillinase repressor|nr:BlaI/MecI/CopY family transcriptional regulator [Candidatus Poribacteria bacterium]MBT5533168.1 BlaI/MecI/CopY family transcriptional regulator [Candidatus Poribacteria bacterium]MBT5712830.1 BlaI/MecI/CopY family transcriptional regulator [Candidatus Poribacteria bacterium]MBT7100906.1 BlaI/MecI/CopY family transcriptional regulator [Candidatus Poribacteria bacterium]MBT7807819.1 BlaI/MecI/CopY family transcriptional regulator [Candidatus Poribacteria bacterium]